MSKTKVYNQTGSESKEMELNDKVFGVKPKLSVIHQVFVALQANKREPWADTKSKGEVRGGGRKPWKQKGTGRARHGSSRSPIWRGGGITFGPLTDRNYDQKINKKMNKEALVMSLSGRVLENNFIVLENLPDTGKTKDTATLFVSLPCKNRRAVVVVDKITDNLKKSLNNLSKVELKDVSSVNVSDVLNNQFFVITLDALKKLEKRLA